MDHLGIVQIYILVAKDHFTWYTVMKAIPNKMAAVILSAELDQIFSWFGYPLVNIYLRRPGLRHG